MSRFLREIYEQPDALRRTIAHLSSQLTDVKEFTKFRQIIFTGMDCINILADDEWTAPLLEIVPAQLLAARLSAAPDTYHYSQKVTTQQ